jgi:hypothetical protein
MSNARGALSLRRLGDATSVPIAWTWTEPRIKNGRRPPQPSRLPSPAARQSLFLPGNSDGKLPQRRGEGEERRVEMAIGKPSRGPNRGFYLSQPPRSALRYEWPFTVLRPLPLSQNCPRSDRGVLVISGAVTFVRHEDPSGASLLRCNGDRFPNGSHKTRASSAH